MTVLCNSPLPAVFPRPWLQKKEAPLPARILTNGPRQTRQDLNRMPEKGVQKRTGCPTTPQGATGRTRGDIQRTDQSGRQRSKKRLISSMKPVSSSLVRVLSIFA